jgi:hypothetical protein
MRSLSMPTVAVAVQLMEDVAEGTLPASKALAPLERAIEGKTLG